MTLEQLLKSVGSRIAELRGKCHLTQKALSAKSGITYRYLQTIESGRANVTLGTLHRLAEYLEVNVPELLHPPRGKGSEPSLAAGKDE